MKTIEESVLTAMDCTDETTLSYTDKGLLPYLPYILQDFWEIGSNPETMIELIKKHFTAEISPKVLDLGCGKGAVSVKVAKHLNCECHGIDAIPEFISFAQSKSEEYGVGNLCRFEVDDIREKIKTLEKYDVIILGAIGQVLGNYLETLAILDNNLNEDGIIIIDDGYIEDHGNFTHDQILKKSDLLKQISNAGMYLADEIVAAGEHDISATYDTEYENLLKRCEELCKKHPDKAELFKAYSNQQKKEYDNLKNRIVCSTMVIKKV